MLTLLVLLITIRAFQSPDRLTTLVGKTLRTIVDSLQYCRTVLESVAFFPPVLSQDYLDHPSMEEKEDRR